MENNQRPTIAIMLGDTQSSYSEDLLRGFYTCAREEDINIIFLMGPQMPQYCKDILSCSFDGDYNYQFDTIYDYVHFTKPDALIITYGSLSIFKSNQVKADFLSHYKDIPFLMLEDTPDDPGIPYLIADNYNGMRQCIEHLVNVHGYRKIAFVAGPANNKDSNERLKAYRDVMAEHQLPVTNDMVVYGNYSELVTEQVEYILDHNPELEAIAFANDNMAKAGYRVCAARDLLVGHDIAITGFDDIDHAKTASSSATRHYRMRLCSVRERSHNPAGCQPFFTREAPAAASCTPALPHCVISAWSSCTILYTSRSMLWLRNYSLPFHTKKIVITIPKFYMHILKIYMKKSLSGRELASPTSL